MKSIIGASIFAIAAALAMPAAAQSTEQEDAGSDGGIDEIIVTAQFREQSLQEAPLGITALDADLIEARSQTSITDVANSAPSVRLTTGGSGGGAQTASVAIRGIGTTDFQFPVEPGVGVYIDDVYYGISFGSSFDLVDVDRVEILRGPQGTLSGKNSIGGSIKLFSRRPDADPDAYVSATYGSYDRIELRAASNFTLAEDRLYARVTGLARHVDGFFRRYDYTCATGDEAPGGVFATQADDCQIGTEGGQEIFAVRGALRWLASDTIENNLVVDYSEDRSEASPTKLLMQPTFPSGNNYLTGPEEYSSYANYTGFPGTPNQYTLPAISSVTSWGVANTLEIGLSDVLSLTSITAFRHADGRNSWDPDGSPESIFTNFNLFDHDQFSQELRLSATVANMLDLTFGGYYYDANSHVGGRINVEAVGLDFSFYDPFKQTSKSAFAHAVLHVNDRLNVTGGLRYTKEDKTYTFTRESAIPGIPTDFRVAGLDGIERSFSGGRWDYRIAVDYEIFDDVRPYVQIATGFKGGGINPRPFFASQAVPFGQETVTSYEVGFKSMLFDRRLRFNAAAYHTDYNGYQAQLLNCPDLSPPGLGNVCAATQNIGGAQIEGFEIELEARPIDGLSIDGTLSYVNFTFNDDIASASGITPATRPQFVPEWQFALGAQYEAELASGATITPRLDYVYRSSIESNAINNVPGFTFGTSEGIGLLNGRIKYQTSNEDWELAVAVTNILDEFYYVNKYDRAAGFSAVYGQTGRPREWSVSLKRNF